MKSLIIFRNNTKLLYIIFLLCIVSACKTKAKKFPELRNLSELKSTEFVATLENEISKDNNAIYCVTLLFAWEEISSEIALPISVDTVFKDLYLLNHSGTHVGVLERGEYVASGKVSEDAVIAKAEFSKSLPFALKLNSYEDKLVFGDKRVESFGIKGSDTRLIEIVKIHYYKNEDNFIIGLQPKDVNHEILLFKSDQNYSTQKESFINAMDLIPVGKQEAIQEENKWKYEFSADDELVIPKFSFHVESNFPSLEGVYFLADEKSYRVESALQRVAFLLDESGAKIESKAEFEILSLPPDRDFEGPKKMIFDKPFFLFLKRKDALKPYFGLWVVNSELMIKE